MFDSTCKFLAESFSSDFASWLIGEPIALTELSPTELSLEPIRADSLILLQSDTVDPKLQTLQRNINGFRLHNPTIVM